MTASIETLQRSLDIISNKVTSGLPQDPADLSTMRSQAESLFSELRDECDGRPEHWEMVCESLAEVIPSIYALIDSFFAAMETIRQENSSMREKQKNIIVELQEINQKFEKKLKEMEGDKFQLVLGQIAFDIDHMIASRVLDEIIVKEHYVDSISKVEKAIKYPESCYAYIFETSEQS